MKEQRQLPRWEVKKKVRVWMPQTQGFTHCIIEDMHLKGMCVTFNKPLPQEQPVKMSFAVGDISDFINIEATIPWSKEVEGRYVYGLSFSRISDEDKNRIYKYTNTNCYEQFKNKWWA